MANDRESLLVMQATRGALDSCSELQDTRAHGRERLAGVGAPECPSSNVRYPLKTPYRDGTTHVIFEPLDVIARLASLVPKRRVNLTRVDARHPWRSPYGRTARVQIHSR